MKDIKNHYGEEISNGKMKKSLSKGRECEINGTQEDNQGHFLCYDLELLSDKQYNRKPYNLLQIEVDEEQEGNI